MFDDPKRELKRLETELLQEEDGDWLDRELAQAHALLGDEPQEPELDYREFTGTAPVRNYANGYGAQVPEMYDEEDSLYADEEPAPLPRQKGIQGLVLLALLELAGIAGIVLYWLRMML